MKLIIAGSRTITDKERVFAHIDRVIQSASEQGITITEIVSGGARGIDKLGESYAKTHSIPLMIFPADWNKYGKSAGYIRNKEMAEYADCLLAIWDRKSKGTKHMIDLAGDNNLTIYSHISLYGSSE